MLRRWTGAFLSLFFSAPPPTRLHSPRGLPTPEGVAATPRSVCGLLSRHRQTHICANFLTADEATGGISQCHWRHLRQIHTHTHTHLNIAKTQSYQGCSYITFYNHKLTHLSYEGSTLVSQLVKSSNTVRQQKKLHFSLRKVFSLLFATLLKNSEHFLLGLVLCCTLQMFHTALCDIN